MKKNWTQLVEQKDRNLYKLKQYKNNPKELKVWKKALKATNKLMKAHLKKRQDKIKENALIKSLNKLSAKQLNIEVFKKNSKYKKIFNKLEKKLFKTSSLPPRLTNRRKK